MRPKRLRLRNFGCFRGEHDVDFGSLGSDLFAIAGPTGSGKSTLLDAMTWALYGATPRLGARPNEHILTPGENDLSVVLEFTAGGQEYRATRGLKRRPSGTASEAKLERRAADGTWKALAETDRISAYEAKLREVVGLDYDGYVRAVTLPQNAFDEFLRGDDKKRREVIKALLGARTIERIRDLAVREKEQVAAARDQAKARIDGEYDGVTPAREAELAAELKGLEADLERAREAHRADLAALQEHERLEQADAELRAAADELVRLAGEEAAVATARERLERGTAARSVAPAVKAFRSRERELSDAAREAAAAREASARAATERESAAAALAAASRERDAAKPELTRRLEAIEGGRRDAALLARHGAALTLAADADDGPFDAERLDELVRLAGQAGELRHLERAASEAARAAAEARAELRRRRERLAGLEARLERIVADGKGLRAAANAAKEAYEAARVEHAAQALREHLHVGDTCPVCHGTVASVPPSDAAVDLSALRRAAEDAEARVKDLLQAHAATKEEVRAEQEAVARLDAELRDRHEPAVRSAEAELRAALEPFAAFGATAADVARALEDERRAQLARLAKRLTAVTGGRDFDALLAETTGELERLDAAVEAARTRLAAADTALAAANATLGAAEAREGAARTSLAEAETDLAAALSASRFATAAEAESAVLDPAEAERLRALVAGHEARRAEADAKRAAAERALAGRAYDAGAHGALAGRVAALAADVARLGEELGGARQRLEDVRRRLEQLAALNAELRELEERLAVLANLDLYLRSDRFEAYVLGHALADLAANASVIIHELTEGRYELTYEDEFFVRDTWMDSYRRSVKTLSGGESFIVSLSLALALADTIAGRQSLGALFLDEGFGTLDAESLDSVTEVLTNLTSTGRMVGVITHVTSLTERLPARLVVSKGQLGSSLAWDA